MGNQQGIAAVDPVHVRMYSNLLQIRDPYTRVQMIQMCMNGMEYIQSAKRAGVYSYLLHYVSSVQQSGTVPLLPGEHASAATPSVSNPLPLSRPSSSSSTFHSSMSLPSVPNNNKPPSTSSSFAVQHASAPSSWKVVAETPVSKATTYFASCLEVLGIQEEIVLDMESLKKSYKRAAIRAHPDKGGTEEQFHAVTHAYTYLAAILKQMKGTTKNTTSPVGPADPAHAVDRRAQDAKQWEFTGEPIHLNPDKLDLSRFNQMFDQLHIPDPGSDGYGDWLKSAGDSISGGSSKPMFKGEFNRDVFNRMFEEETRNGKSSAAGGTSSHALMVHPEEMALTLNPSSGVNYLGHRPDSFTAAPNDKMQYTDLRGAYSGEASISDKVADVRVGTRNLEQYRASREKAPDPLTDTEMHAIHAFEQRQKQAAQLQERRRAEAAVQQQSYFERMKQQVITDRSSAAATDPLSLTYRR